jgi:hypothetical protein
MNAKLPPGAPVPLWARREFRLFLLVSLMGFAVIGTFVFEIGPMIMRGRAKRETAAKAPSPKGWQPRAGGAEQEPEAIRFDGVLDKVQDSTPIQTAEIGYVRLLKFMEDSKADTLGKDAKYVDYAYFPKYPAQLRGQTTRVMALFQYSSPIRLDKPVGQIEWIHRTYLTNMTAMEGYVVDLLEPPGELAKRTLVTMDAAFLKLATYDGQRGPVQAPFFVGKSLRVYREHLAKEELEFRTLGIAAGGMSVMALLYVWFRLRRKDRAGWTSGGMLDKTVSKA